MQGSTEHPNKIRERRKNTGRGVRGETEALAQGDEKGTTRQFQPNAQKKMQVKNNERKEKEEKRRHCSRKCRRNTSRKEEKRKEAKKGEGYKNNRERK